MRIALFTPYSPELGGGSVQLRSHIEQLPELDIQWYYLSPAALPPERGARRQWLGRPFTPSKFLLDLCARTGILPGSTRTTREIVSRLHADLFWIVAHYEGICVADELLAQGKKVHLTVHDEPLAMCVRSRRYRLFRPLIAHTFSRVLRGAQSVDTTSTVMRDYFLRTYHVDCFALYKYLAELPLMPDCRTAHTLTVGHIGSLYHPAPFRRFVRACREYATQHQRSLKIVRIGSSPEMDKVAAESPGEFEQAGELLEKDALPVLARCDFVYAMYPQGHRFEGFRRMSLPIKLSTYVQAQRPIFAHTPEDSGLAQLVSRYGVGAVCSSQEANAIRQSIEDMLVTQVTRENFEALRRDLMGEEQVLQLREALSGATAR